MQRDHKARKWIVDFVLCLTVYWYASGLEGAMCCFDFIPEAIGIRMEAIIGRLLGLLFGLQLSVKRHLSNFEVLR